MDGNLKIIFKLKTESLFEYLLFFIPGVLTFSLRNKKK